MAYKIEYKGFIVTCDSPREVLDLIHELPRGVNIDVPVGSLKITGHAPTVQIEDTGILALRTIIQTGEEGISGVALSSNLRLSDARGLGPIMGKLRRRIEEMEMDWEEVLNYEASTQQWYPAERAGEALRRLSGVPERGISGFGGINWDKGADKSAKDSPK